MPRAALEKTTGVTVMRPKFGLSHSLNTEYRRAIQRGTNCYLQICCGNDGKSSGVEKNGSKRASKLGCTQSGHPYCSMRSTEVECYTTGRSTKPHIGGVSGPSAARDGKTVCRAPESSEFGLLMLLTKRP